MWITSCTVSIIAVATVAKRSHCVIGKQYINVKIMVDHFILVLNLKKSSVIFLSGLMFHWGGGEGLVTKRELDQYLLLIVGTVALLLKRELHPLFKVTNIAITACNFLYQKEALVLDFFTLRGKRHY